MQSFVIFLLVAKVLAGVSACTDPFKEVGGRCVYLEPFVEVDWQSARYMCHEMDSELVVADDPTFYYHLLHHIRDEELDERCFWIGASDSEVEGEWKWVNGKAVESGSPFWSVVSDSQGHYYMEPGTDTKSNCLYLERYRGLYFVDGNCSYKNAVICEQPSSPPPLKED